MNANVLRWLQPAILLVVGGCAFTDAEIPLSYAPVTESRDFDAGFVVVNSFSDTRPNPNIIGEVRNLNMKRTADMLVRDQDAASWVADAVAQELRRAGYTPTDNAALEAPSVGGEITELFISHGADFILTCRLRVKFTVRQGSEIILEKDYIGKGTEEADTGLEKEGGAAAERALQSLLSRAIPDFVEVWEQ